MNKKLKYQKLNIANLQSKVSKTLEEKLDIKRGGLMAIVTITFLSLITITIHLQFTQGIESAYAAQANLSRGKQLPPARGLFYDREGKKLVVNENSYDLTITAEELTSERKAKLESVLGIAVEQGEAQGQDKVYLKTGLNSNELVELTSKLTDIPIEFTAGVSRNYLFPNNYAHIIGYTGLASGEDVKNGALLNDKVGKYRLEKQLNNELAGVRGREISLAESISQTESVAGDNVFLTINNDWQASLTKLLGNQVQLLGAQAGAAVVVDISNGDIWAYASVPSFDSNLFSKAISNTQYQELLAARGRPLIDKVVGLQAAPGSVFKIITAHALLQNSIIDANTKVFSKGCMPIGNYEFCEFGDRLLGSLDVTTALQKSSNIFFCTAGLQLDNVVGVNRLVEAAQQLGLGSVTSSGLEGEVAGNMASPEYKMKTFGEKWFPGDTCNTVIGQGMVTVTPLQMAMAVSTIANGGDYYHPNLIDKIADQSGQVLRDDFRKLDRTIALAPDTQRLILDGMFKVAHEPSGSAARFMAKVPGNVRAKTGSAEAAEEINGVAQERVHSWVAGTFDYNGKTFAYAAHIHFGGGSWNVTPVMADFIKCLHINFGGVCK